MKTDLVLPLIALLGLVALGIYFMIVNRSFFYDVAELRARGEACKSLGEMLFRLERERLISHETCVKTLDNLASAHAANVPVGVMTALTVRAVLCERETIRSSDT